MKGRWKDRHVWYRRVSRKHLLYMFLFFVSAVSVAGFVFTGEKLQKVQKMSTRNVSIDNIGSEVMELNPLRKVVDPELDNAVKAYYENLAAGQNFVEAYDDINVYSKKGKQRNTYVVFATYKMKIKDIYSEVLGLETFYAVRNEQSDEYQIYSEVLDGQMKSDVQTVLEHEDVKELFARVEIEYNETIQSDALLREAVADLQNACEELPAG